MIRVYGLGGQEEIVEVWDEIKSVWDEIWDETSCGSQD
jgi:hypothetical protein